MAVSSAESTATPGAVTFKVDPGLQASLGGYSDSEFRGDIKTLHGRGTKVILSVGGKKGTVAVNDAASSARSC